MLSMKRSSPLLRYGVAVLAVGVAFLIKLLLDPLISRRPLSCWSSAP